MFQNIVLVDVADCHNATAYLEHVATLPAVETLVVRGPEFTDEHLRRLHRLATLRRFVLDSTRIPNHSNVLRIPLKDLNDLGSDMRYHTSVTAAGIDELRRALPNCDVSGIVLAH